MRVTKKAVTVSAWQFPMLRDATVENGSDDSAGIPYWVLIAIARGQLVLSIEGPSTVETEQGQQSAQPGDWLMRGVEGELYSCPSSVFDKTYEFDSGPERAARR